MFKLISKTTFPAIVLIALATVSFAQPPCTDADTRGNCVTFVRTEVPSFPPPATTYSDKTSHINHHFPTVGSVAIMPGSTFGHVAVVKSVGINAADGTLNLTVDEANWRSCYIDYGVPITMASRNIAGFFDPNYVSSSAPTPDLTNVGYTAKSGSSFNITATGSGFDPTTAKGVILGGGCNTFTACQVPNNVFVGTKSSTSLTIPVTLPSGHYQLYIFNSGSGKTSQGKSITVP
jgi:hypothetical protein